MVSVNELQQQHAQLLELMQVLSVLIHDETVRDSAVTHELFIKLANKVKNHFDVEDGSLYGRLLTDGDPRVRHTAGRFLSGSHDLERFFLDYVQNWCKPGSTRQDCQQFIEETDEMFRLLEQRIRLENTELYPLAASVA